MCRFTPALLFRSCWPRRLGDGGRRPAREKVFRPSGRRGPRRGDRTVVSGPERPVSTFASASPPRRSNAIPGPTRRGGHGGAAFRLQHSLGHQARRHHPSSTPKLDDWMNADLGQRSVSTLLGMTEYYRYTGDPAAIGMMTLTADYLLDYCQTPADHPWPNFIISAPTKGRPTAGPTRTASSSWTSARSWLGRAGGLQGDGQSALPARPSRTGPTCWPSTATCGPARCRGTATPTPRIARGDTKRRPGCRSPCGFSTT